MPIPTAQERAGVNARYELEGSERRIANVACSGVPLSEATVLELISAIRHTNAAVSAVIDAVSELQIK